MGGGGGVRGREQEGGRGAVDFSLPDYQQVQQRRKKVNDKRTNWRPPPTTSNHTKKEKITDFLFFYLILSSGDVSLPFTKSISESYTWSEL